MFGAKGLPRADRELGAVVASRFNGCAYCASVHALRFTQLTKQPEVMERIQADGVEAVLEPRRRRSWSIPPSSRAIPPRSPLPTLRLCARKA